MVLNLLVNKLLLLYPRPRFSAYPIPVLLGKMPALISSEISLAPRSFAFALPREPITGGGLTTT